MRDLSIIIPSRNEEFLSRTVEDILKNIRGNTEVIVVLDGCWADPPLKDHERVTVVHRAESIGQRAAQNEAARLSEAKYLMKADAHCAFDEGFDVKMMGLMRDDWTMVPIMKNFHIFDWVCEDCGWRRYQGPPQEECKECGGKNVKKDVVWRPKPSPNSTSYLFNTMLQFGYFNNYKKRYTELGYKDVADTMSLQGSCFMCTRENYWKKELCDESWGSWGQQGTEVACKTWLSGGRVVCNLKTWYAHMFRTQPGFMWPYPAPGRSQRDARQLSRDIFYNNKWGQQVHPLSWLIEKFKPVPGWHDKEGEEVLARVNRAGEEFYKRQAQGKPTKGISKGMVYYTDSQLDPKIDNKVKENLKKISRDKGIEIVCASLKKTTFGDKNIYFPSLKRGYLSMFKQMFSGIENSKADIIFLVEHDVLYHPSHFDFVPPRKDVFYYNTAVWRLRSADGLAVRTDDCRQASGICAYRELLLGHYRERVKMVEKKLKELGEGVEFRRFIRQLGFEPATHGRIREFSHLKSERWESEFPNVDIKHGGVLTQGKWKPESYRNKRFAKGFRTAEEIPGWGKTEDIIRSFK